MLSTRPIAAHRPENSIARQTSRDAAAGDGADAASFTTMLDAAVGHVDGRQSGGSAGPGPNGGNSGAETFAGKNDAVPDNATAVTVADMAPDRKIGAADRKADSAKDDDNAAAAAESGKQASRARGTIAEASIKPPAASPVGNQTAAQGAALVAAAMAPIVLAQLPPAVGQPAVAAFDSPRPAHSPMALNALVGGSKPTATTASNGPSESDGKTLSTADAGATDADTVSFDPSQIPSFSVAMTAGPHFGDTHDGVAADAPLALPMAGFAGVTVAGSNAGASGGFDASASDQGSQREGASTSLAAIADSPYPTTNGLSFQQLADGPATFGPNQPWQNLGDAGPSDAVDQVSSMMMASLRNGDQDIVLHLRPPELGDVNVRVVINGQQVSAWFDAAQAQVQQAIGQGMGQLQTDLAAAGYNLAGAWVGGEAWTPRGWSEQTPKGAPAPNSPGPSGVGAIPAGVGDAASAAVGVSIYV